MIKKSVGINGVNNYDDVVVVQSLINSCVMDISGLATIPVDGICSPKTVAAITQIKQQLSVSDIAEQLVSPGSDTLKKLTDKSKAISTTKITSFPLKVRPAQSYKEGMRKFGAKRSGGRLHAGCDLYARKGEEILALRDGVVVGDMYEFYLGTYAIEVNHGDIIARYGEISGVANNIKKGAKVKAGQVIAYVGYLKKLNI